MLNFSTGLRNYMAATGSLRAALGSCVLKLFAGTPPASADAALAGNTLLRTYTGGGDGTTALAWEATPVDGAIVKSVSQTWEGDAVAGGDATFFRIETLADAGGSSTSAVRIQGNVRLAGGDLNISNLTIVNTAPGVLDSGAIAIPAQ